MTVEEIKELERKLATHTLWVWRPQTGAVSTRLEHPMHYRLCWCSDYGVEWRSEDDFAQMSDSIVEDFGLVPCVLDQATQGVMMAELMDLPYSGERAGPRAVDSYMARNPGTPYGAALAAVLLAQMDLVQGLEEAVNRVGTPCEHIDSGEPHQERPPERESESESPDQAIPFPFPFRMDEGSPVLRDVYSGIGIETDLGEYGICQRDGGIEVWLDGDLVYGPFSDEWTKP